MSLEAVSVCVCVRACIMSDDPIPCRDAMGHLLWPFLYAQAKKQLQTDEMANSLKFTRNNTALWSQ